MIDKWSEEAWQAAEPVIEAINSLPFVRELGNGTLDRTRFIFYLKQDSLYIENYCKVLAMIAAKAPTLEITDVFLKFAADGVAVERGMHAEYLSGEDKASEMTPTCLLYCSLLNSQSMEDVAVQAAAVLPCFWVYREVGLRINAMSNNDNPYRDWIATYSDAEFSKSTDKAIEICNTLATAASESTRRKMTEIFVKCTRMEWMFWQSAYDLEQWPI